MPWTSPAPFTTFPVRRTVSPFASWLEKHSAGPFKQVTFTSRGFSSSQVPLFSLAVQKGCSAGRCRQRNALPSQKGDSAQEYPCTSGENCP